jgi:hypothetical protein
MGRVRPYHARGQGRPESPAAQTKTVVHSWRSSPVVVGIVLIALMVAGIKRILSGLLGRSLPRTTSDRRPNPRSQQRRGPRPASSSSATNDLSRTSASHALASARERQGAALRPDSLAAVLALGGLIVYTLLYVAALRFYRPLGVSPTDVGLDYGTLLAQCAFTVVAPLTAAALVILVVAVFANRVGRLHHSEPRGAHGADRRALWPAWASPRAKRFLAVVLLVYLILYLCRARFRSRGRERPDSPGSTTGYNSSWNRESPMERRDRDRRLDPGRPHRCIGAGCTPARRLVHGVPRRQQRKHRAVRPTRGPCHARRHQCRPRCCSTRRLRVLWPQCCASLTAARRAYARCDPVGFGVCIGHSLAHRQAV